jgi:hypothetical protein
MTPDLSQQPLSAWLVEPIGGAPSPSCREWVNRSAPAWVEVTEWHICELPDGLPAALLPSVVPACSMCRAPDPPLTAARAAYPAPPFLPVLHPPVELAGARPGGYLNFTLICLGKLLQIIVGKLHV